MGVLIGNAFRSKSCMPFNLVPMVWKQLCNIDPTEDDLESIDAYTYQTFKKLRKLVKENKSFTEDAEENDTDPLVFTVTIGKQIIELCEGGKEKLVEKDNLDEFIKLTVEFHQNRALQQIKWLKEGIDLIIPL